MIDDEYLEEDEGPRQPPLYLVTGLVIGLGIGLLFSLVISPVRFVDTAPVSLQAAHKDSYRLLISQAFQANGDLLRASQRLLLLEDASPMDALASQAQRWLGEGQSEESARALAELAAALSVPSDGPPSPPVVLSPPTPAGATPGLATAQVFETLDLSQAVQTATLPLTPTPTTSPTITPIPTFTPRVGHSPVPTLGAPFVLTGRVEICDPAIKPGLLQIELRDSAGVPIPGVQITVAWEGGLDTFFTGLHPASGPGYADFSMTAGVVYSLRVSDISETINGLSAPACAGEDGRAYIGALRLEFNQP